MKAFTKDGLSRRQCRFVRNALTFIVLTTVCVLLHIRTDGPQRSEGSVSSESVNSQTVAEPVNSQTVAESVTPQTVAESVNPESFSETINLQTVAESVNSQTVAEPVNLQTVAESMNQQTVAESVNPSRNVNNTSHCPAIDMGSILPRLKEFCGGMKRSKNNWHELITMYSMKTRRLVYDLDRNYVWVTVPKIASSNWKRLIIADRFEPESKRLEYGLENPQIVLENCCQLNSTVALNNYALQHAFTFAFIRHPWTRLYSAYMDKIVEYARFDHYNYIKYILQIARGWSNHQIRDTGSVIEQAATVTFTEFLTMLASSDTDTYNIHWTPWFTLTKACQIKYNYIGYVEDMNPAFTHIKETVFPDSDVSLPPPYPSKAKQQQVREAYREVPTSLLDAVYRVFEDDFIIGGYSRNIDCIP